MRIACNYFPEVVQLIKESKINIDYLKFPSAGYQMWVFKNYDLSDFKDIMNHLKESKPVLLHGLNPVPHNICSNRFIEEFDIIIARKVMEISNSPGISLHLSGIDQAISREENLEIITRNVLFLKNNFSDISFISLENVPDSSRFGICADPEFISEAIYRSGAEFLLDVSHAYCAAKELNVDFNNYLSQLPLDRTYEIHINGWIEKNSDIMCHTKINEHGYETLANLLKVCSPQIITIEYGRGSDEINAGIPLLLPDLINERAKLEIIEQVKRIKEIIGHV